MYIILRKILLTTVLVFSTAGLAYATPITYDFSASGFTDLLGTMAAPNDPVSGSFSLDGGILSAIDLTLGTHTYTTSEVGFDPNWGGSGDFLLGGTYVR